MIINVYPTPRTTSNAQVLKRVKLEGWRGGKTFRVAGDLNVDLRLFCMEDSDDLADVDGSQYWYGVEAVPGGLNRAMWLEILTQVDCTALPGRAVTAGERGQRTNFAVRLHFGSQNVRGNVPHPQRNATVQYVGSLPSVCNHQDGRVTFV